MAETFPSNRILWYKKNRAISYILQMNLVPLVFFLGVFFLHTAPSLKFLDLVKSAENSCQSHYTKIIFPEWMKNQQRQHWHDIVLYSSRQWCVVFEEKLKWVGANNSSCWAAGLLQLDFLNAFLHSNWGKVKLSLQELSTTRHKMKTHCRKDIYGGL